LQDAGDAGWILSSTTVEVEFTGGATYLLSRGSLSTPSRETADDLTQMLPWTWSDVVVVIHSELST
jgi:hypothetical protein